MLNKVILLGNITRDPETRSIPSSGSSVTRTGIAVNRKFRGSDGSMKDDVMFIDIVAFGRTAETISEYVTKGTQLLVEGRLSFNSWEQEGVKRSKHEVIIESFSFVGNRNDSKDRANSQNKAPANDDSLADDDIPF